MVHKCKLPDWWRFLWHCLGCNGNMLDSVTAVIICHLALIVHECKLNQSAHDLNCQMYWPTHKHLQVWCKCTIHKTFNTTCINRIVRFVPQPKCASVTEIGALYNLPNRVKCLVALVAITIGLYANEALFIWQHRCTTNMN